MDILKPFMPKLFMGFADEGGGNEGDAGNGDAGDSGDAGAGDAGDAGSEGNKGADEGNDQTLTIPEEYKNKPWAKDLKSVDDLYKQHDGVQELIGKKSLPPDFEGMTEVQRDEYYKTTRPEKASDYKMPEGLGDDVDARMREIFHNKGLSQFRAFELATEFKQYNDEMKDLAFNKDKWVEELKTSFGSDFEKKAADTATFIAKNLNELDKKVLELAPNPVLGLIYRLADNLKKSHGIVDGGLGGEHNAGDAAGVDLDKTRGELRQQITDLSSRQHTQEEKSGLIKKLNATYK